MTVSLEEEVRTQTQREDHVKMWGEDSHLQTKERGHTEVNSADTFFLDL